MMLTINPKNPNPADIDRVVRLLQAGGVIAYPTDTIYGFGCDSFQKKAVEKIIRLKQRKNAKKHVFSSLCGGMKQAGQYAVISDNVFQMMKQALPGPFTFILPASQTSPREVVLKKKRTIGIRIPDHEFCRQVVLKLGRPIVTTSVNISGDANINDPKEIERLFGKNIDLVIDGGILSGEPSTIVDATVFPPLIVRQGKGVLEQSWEA